MHLEFNLTTVHKFSFLNYQYFLIFHIVTEKPC